MHCNTVICRPLWVVMLFIVAYVMVFIIISCIFSVRFNPGRVIWKRHVQNTSPELQTKVDVLKDMLMYREDKHQCIFTNEELETIICHVCIE